MTEIYPYKHILVAVDGSKITSNVLESAIDSALRNHASLDILRIVQLTQLTDGYSNAVDAGVEDVNVHIRFGNPKRVIAHEFPSDHNTDLIILGATGVSGLERFVLGSVTHYVSRMAKCDVLVVRKNDHVN